MGNNKVVYDIVSEGLEQYFDSLVENMTEADRKSIPRDLFLRIQKGKTLFPEKMAVMWKSFNKECYIVVKDENEGFLASDFEANIRELKHRNSGEQATRDFIAKGNFVLGTDSICRGIHYQAMLAGAPMFRFLRKARGAQVQELARQRKDTMQFAKMMLHYEDKKKEYMRQLKMTLAEMYCLFFFSDGSEKKGSDIYVNLKFDAFGAGKSRTLSALKRLTRDGYLEKFGKTNTATYRLTALGYDAYYTLLSKYIFNF